MAVEHFNVSAVIGIKIYPERKAGYEWEEAQPEKRTFFGLFKVQESKPAGYRDIDYQGETRYTTEQLLGRGYKITPEKEVLRKCYVMVFLTHDIEVTREFDRQADAVLWAESIMKLSGNEFMVNMNAR
jgi:hypothetical protein